MTSALRGSVACAALLTLAAPALADSAAHHADPIAPVLYAVAVMLAAAKLGGHLAARLGQPAVLGELLAGVAVGNAHLAGLPWFRSIASDPGVDALARLGVIVLLFEVGLESTVREMLRVGRPALAVAVLGVALPFALGWGAGALVLPDRSVYVHAFLGAALTATSVGITARVLQDLGRSKSPEARVILGAAVIDDVLGLVILAIVGSAIASANLGQAVSYGEIAWVVARAGAFLGAALALGIWLAPGLFRLASRLRGRGVLLATALAFCFALSYLASVVGLAPIVGAYAAGLVLEDAHFRDFAGRGEERLERLVQPLASFLVPTFFVLMGAKVDLTAFAKVDVLLLAVALTVAAIIGKQACSFGVLGLRIDRLSVGIGMIPRGEVGLIFAHIGLGLTVAGERVIDEGLFAAVVIMVVVTTLATPPALGWSLRRAERRQRPPAGG